MDKNERKKLNKLKLIPYYHKDYDKVAEKADKSGNFIYNNWWYLHGELERLLRYDKASAINAKECQDLIRMFPRVSKLSKDKGVWKGEVYKINLIPHLYVNDTIECQVIGIDDPCVGYFWTTEESPLEITTKEGETFRGTYWKQRGLVCLKHDLEACSFALQKYKEKSLVL